jgi:hypothetical protein
MQRCNRNILRFDRVLPGKIQIKDAEKLEVGGRYLPTDARKCVPWIVNNVPTLATFQIFPDVFTKRDIFGLLGFINFGGVIQ